MNKLLAIITVTTVLTGCMESSSFSVRDSNEAILERFKWAQNQQLKQNYNDGVSASSDSDFQQFLNGDAQLSCGLSCAWGYGAKRSKLKQLYSNKEWSELAALVLETNHETDQAYYYLGIAAEGLSKPSAAMVYFDRAITAAQKCDTLLINVCDDLDVPTLSRFGKNRVSKTVWGNKNEPIKSAGVIDSNSAAWPFVKCNLHNGEIKVLHANVCKKYGQAMAHSLTENASKIKSVENDITKKSRKSDDTEKAEYEIASVLQSRDTYQAITAFKSFLEKYPQSKLSADALHSLGMQYLISKQNVYALDAFEKFIKHYPNHSKAPSALFKIGWLEDHAGNKYSARNALQRLVSSHPESEFAGPGEKILMRIESETAIQQIKPGNYDSRNYIAKTTTQNQSKLRHQDNNQITSDNIKPTLRITGGNRVSVTSKFFNLEGTVTDTSGIAELAIDGNPTKFDASGTFTVRRFMPVGETKLLVTATDIYGNTATEQVVVTRTSAKTNSFASEPTLGAPQREASQKSNAIALIIGIDEYSKAPRAKHAENDARLFYDYASTSLGIPAHRIKLLTGNKATRVNILSELLWLESTVIENETEVLLYFAGHGLGVPDGNNTFLFTHDSLPTLPKETGLDREELLLKIAQTKPKSTLVFLDTCYSGSGRGGEENLVADSRALVIRPRDVKAPDGFSLFSAASGRQLANSHPQQKNGLFSYYVMRGLNGEADANKDDQLTASELQQYVLSNVKRSANFYGRPQTPELTGDTTRVIADWRKNAPSKASSKGSFMNLFN